MSRSKPLIDAIQAAGRRLTGIWRVLVRTARLAVGIPDYDAYVAHLSRHHPGTEPMHPEAFFRERTEARFGRGRNRCC